MDRAPELGSTQRLHRQAMDAADPSCALGACGTPEVYHSRMEHTREASGLRTEVRWLTGVTHDALNYPINRNQVARCVCFIVQEWMVQVEGPTPWNSSPLTTSSRACEDGLHLNKRWMALGEQTERLW